MSKETVVIPGDDIDNLKKRLAACYEFADEILDATRDKKTVNREALIPALIGINLIVND